MYIYIWLCDNCQLWQLRYDDDVKWEVLSLYYIDCDLPWYPCLGFAWQSSVSQELYIYMYICISLYIYIYQMIRHSLSISATRIGNGWIVLHHGKMDQLKGNALVTGTKCPLQSGWCGGSKHFANIIQISDVTLQADPLGRAAQPWL